jgi:glycosyltransferase involved in cell wall biosynthesis
LTPHIGLNAHLLASGQGYRRAGIHGYIYQLLDHLPRAAPDWRYMVYVGAGQPPSHPQFTVRRSRLNTEKPLNRIVWEQAAQPFQLHGLDLVHEMAFVAPLIMPRPFVVTVYDLTFIRYPERLSTPRRLYLRLFTGLSCNRARRVMAISQSTADDLVNLLHIPREKIDLAIPGVEARFQPLPADEIENFRQANNLPKRFLLFVGTLEPRKNIPILLQAYAGLPEALRREVHLVLAGGTGWMMDDLPTLIKQLGIAETVHLPGYVADSALVLWYNAADAFVYPSVFEGWGLPLTEAMACGKPVITSNVSSLPEAVGTDGRAGLTLDPHDVAAWRDALRRCIEDPAWRHECGAHARERAGQFSWKNTAQQTIESYRRALQRE